MRYKALTAILYSFKSVLNQTKTNVLFQVHFNDRENGYSINPRSNYPRSNY